MELVRDEQPPPAEAMAAAADDGTKQQEPSRVVCFGELLVDFVPTVGGLPVFDEPGFKAGAGGAPANVAVGICKLGIPAAFIGKVGDDEFGYALANVLKEHGVETRGVRFDAHAHTGLAFISLRSDGERTFIFYRNPSADMLMVSTSKDLTVHIHLSQHPQQPCSVCDPRKIFLTSKFSYLLFSNSNREN
jgi:fructokinase